MSNSYDVSIVGQPEDGEARLRAFTRWKIAETALRDGAHVGLHGNPGTGKTTHAETFALDGRDVMTIPVHDEMRADELMGSTQIVNGSTAFRFGNGANAVSNDNNGTRLILDDFHNASNAVIQVCFALAGGHAITMEDGTRIVPGRRLQIVATMNGSPFEMFPPDHGIRDRFGWIEIPEPSDGALSTLPELLRETARKSVRYGVSGFRAFQHFHRMLAANGISIDDAFANGIGEDGEPFGGICIPSGLAARQPSRAERERVIQAVAESTFGPDDSWGMVHAWRIGAARDLSERGKALPTVPETETDRALREAYERGKAESDAVHAAAAVQSQSRYLAFQAFTSKPFPDGSPRQCFVIYSHDGRIVASRFAVDLTEAPEPWATACAGIPRFPTVHVPVTEYDAILAGAK